MNLRFSMFAAASLIMSGIEAEIVWPACNLKLDLAILQDTTGSYFDALTALKSQMPETMEAILDNLPGSRISISEFRDKPFLLLGDADSFCYRPTTRGFVTDNFVVSGAYAELWGTGGGDLPEAQLHSMIRMAYDKETVNWCRSVGAQETYAADECSGKILLIVTDAVPHDPDDYTLYNGADPNFPPVNGTPIPPLVMTPWPDTGLDEITSKEWDEMCSTHEYPSTEQFVQAMKDTDIKVIGIITPQSEKVQQKWNKINAELGQADYMMQFVDANSTSSIVLGLEDAVSRYSMQLCQSIIATEPVSTAETTTTSTTEETTVTTTAEETTVTTTATTSEDTSTTEPETTASVTDAVVTTEQATSSSDGETSQVVTTTNAPTDGESKTADCVWPSKTSSTAACRWPTTSTKGECVSRKDKKHKADLVALLKQLQEE